MNNYYYVKELIENGNESLFVANFNKIISLSTEEEISKMFKDFKMLKIIVKEDLFFKNFDVMFKKINNLYSVFYNLYNFNNDYINKNMNKIIEYQFNSCGFIASYYDLFFEFINYINYSFDKLIDYLNNNINISKSFDVFSYIIKNFSENNKDGISRNIDYFINNSTNLVHLKKVLIDKGYNSKVIARVNDKIDHNLELVIYEILKERFDIEIIKKEKIIDFFKEIIKELCDYEKVEYHDIQKLKSGVYSTAIKIGEKVLKIGFARSNFNIPNNKRYLKPIYRGEIKSISNSNITLMCVEITELVDTDNIDIEDVYKLYKELRDQNLMWTDCKLENIGRLKKDNKVYFDKIEKVYINSTGYKDENDEILKAGEFVIIDNDYIYDANQFFKEYNSGQVFIPSEEFYDFEKRYQNERLEKNKILGSAYERNKQKNSRIDIKSKR